MKLKQFLRLGRPKFLIYSLILQGLGAAAAGALGVKFSPWFFALAQVQITFAHLMTHYFNEYFDFETDSRNLSDTGWTGGSRVLVEGHFKPKIALITALIMVSGQIVLMFLLGSIYPNFAVGYPIGIAVIAVSWAYSAKPIALHSRGLGEFTVMIVLTCLTPLYGFVIQKGAGAYEAFLHSPLLLALLPLCLSQYARMMIMNFPDREADAQVGKRTLVVALGPDLAAKVFSLLIVLTYLSLALMLSQGLPPSVAIAVALPAPAAVYLAMSLLKGAWKYPEKLRKLPFIATLYVMATSLFALVAFLALNYFGRGVK